ncbi:glycoside hydrolase family 68 protein [Sphingobium sp. AN641]|uniref:glycoside hydrolase family 68 protein n=1 Tax=Sphingobium sp. AN641 TaxID=3133443 RepID=UPI0030BD461A
MTSSWTASLLRSRGDTHTVIPAIPAGSLRQLVAGLHLWDFWPVYDAGGEVATVDRRQLWMALSAPDHLSRDQRHDRARIRLLSVTGTMWRDEGNLLPDGFSAGSREWSGCAFLNARTGSLTLYYTAAGERGETATTYRQRIFEAHGKLRPGTPIVTTDWTDHRECLEADGTWYRPATETKAAPGFMTAFRDPYIVADPAGGEEYMLFAGSSPREDERYNGVVGVARRAGSRWIPQPPLISAVGVNMELERPHAIIFEGRYYLFWSTQSHTFHPRIDAPTGLYGMVASAMMGPYVPINGNGLVMRNPSEAPSQTYAWQVLNDLSVVSFADLLPGMPSAPPIFVGTIAPMMRLVLNGERATAQSL